MNICMWIIIIDCFMVGLMFRSSLNSQCVKEVFVIDSKNDPYFGV